MNPTSLEEPIAIPIERKTPQQKLTKTCNQ